MNKRFVLLLIALFIGSNSLHAQPLWEGKWIYERYLSSIGGSLQITNCRDNKCHFEIITYHGAHTCDINGEMAVNENTAVFTDKAEEFEPETPYIIKFTLDAQKRRITVKKEDKNSNIYCGMRGYFEGEYEHETNPLRYKTDFDCWGDDLTAAQKEICASEDLSKADLEVAKNYAHLKTDEWYAKREQCAADEKCLWEFYVKTIRNGYEKRAEKPLNLFEYLGKCPEYMYPDSLILFQDYLQNNMAKEDYDEMRISLSDRYSENGENNQYCYYTYGVPGLYTLYETAFYIDAKEIWLAFISANYDDENKNHIIVYAPHGKTENDIPKKFEDWIERLKKNYPQGIKLKYFREHQND